MKALVLGATGFIGSHVVRALVQEGVDVRILRRQSSPHLALKGLKLEESIGDMNDFDSLKKAVKGCEVIFHVAAYYALYSFEKEKQKTLALQQMKNVLKAAEGVSKFIYTSSLSTIGRPVGAVLVTGGNPLGTAPLSNEDTPYNPADFTGLYYEVKYLLEQEALRQAQQGLPVVIVNPTGVFGDYDVKPTSGSLVVAIASGKLPVLFDAKMNAVDVHDVARGQVAAMKIGKVGRRYILGSHNTTVWEIAHLIARLAKVSPPRLKLPIAVGEVAAYASEIVGKFVLHQDKPLIPRVGIDFLKYGMHYDTSRAKTELGFTSTPMEETFDRAIVWFRKNQYI